jgi:SMC interacting uncharacterized protein involved in chromosome segregation
MDRATGLSSFVVIALLAAGLTLGGCEPSQPEPQSNGAATTESQQDASEASEKSRPTASESPGQAQRELRQAMSKTKGRFVETAEQQLDTLQAEMDRLAQQAAKKGQAAEQKYQQLKQQFGDGLDRAQSELDKLKESGSAAWGELAQGFNQAASEMHTAYKEAKAQFQKPATQPSE